MNKVHDHLNTKHIPKDNTFYIKRLKSLQKMHKGNALMQFGIDPFDDMDPRTGSIETTGTVKGFEEDGLSQGVIGTWLIMESRANSIDWNVDQLLNSMKESDREKLSVIPVRIIDANKLDINIIYNNDDIYITIDRSLVLFVDYILRLINIEIFRPVKSEFLSDPPSHEDVLKLIKKAGSYYHRGEWSSSIYPISKMHFRQALNLNLARAKIGAIIFLIAHEYGHIRSNHTSDFYRNIRSWDLGDYSASFGLEIQADQYAIELVISTIANLTPLKSDRAHFEIGIILFLIGLNLVETVILIELNFDFDEFKRSYAQTHGTGFSRLKFLINNNKELFTPQTLSMLPECIDIGNLLAIDLKNTENRNEEA